jgi:CRISPR-associated protein Cas5d
MKNSFAVHFFGERACFTNIAAGGRYSYPIPSYSALIGMVESIYWKPQMRYVLTKLSVLSPIKYSTITRNEIAKKQLPDYKVKVDRKYSIHHNQETEKKQVLTSFLVDVSYVIEGYVESLIVDKSSKEYYDDVQKHISMVTRRIEKGQCYRHPYGGCSEFPLYFKEVNENYTPINVSKDFGFMPKFIDFSNEKRLMTPIQMTMANGVIQFGDSV